MINEKKRANPAFGEVFVNKGKDYVHLFKLNSSEIISYVRKNEIVLFFEKNEIGDFIVLSGDGRVGEIIPGYFDNFLRV